MNGSKKYIIIGKVNLLVTDSNYIKCEWYISVLKILYRYRYTTHQESNSVTDVLPLFLVTEEVDDR